MNIIQELANWTKTLPPWQSDAVRRIFTQDELTADDESQLFQMLLSTHELSDSEKSPVAPCPFSDAINGAATVNRKVLLNEIHSVQNVNALIPDQSLKFCLDGMTIIFGENGAGKSGYARIFKHACHAREKSQPILCNVTKPTKSKPAAIVELLVNGEPVALRWQVDAPPSGLLSDIAVFDSHCARVFIDEANEVVYLPFGLDTFSRLVALFSSLSERIVAERRKIPVQFDQVNEYCESTSAGRFVRSLSATSDLKQLESISSLDALSTARLEELRILVASAKANSPKSKAAELRRMKTRFEQLKSRISAIATELSPDALAAIAQLQANTEVTKAAAELASAEAFSGEPLNGTGSEPWRVLFDAARSFSESLAYPNESFPVVRDEAVCLLCQQPLAESARHRLARFENFIKDNAARKRDEAAVALRTAIKVTSDLKLNAIDDDPSLLEDIRVRDPELANRVSTFFIQAKEIQSAVKTSVAENRRVTNSETFANPSDLVGSAVLALESEAQQYDVADNPEEFKKIANELTELEDRARLHRHRELVTKYIALKQREAKLKRCEKALDTNSITRRGSELMERAVTGQLTSNLIAEINRFGLHCAPVQVKKMGQKGKTKHQIVVSDSAKPSGILSEGEQRVIAISAFLAELRAGDSQSPIIFDDPVSSLDHRHREKVAQRLVEESKTRQVVVFTHDVVLLLALERESSEQRVPLLIQTVTRSPAGPGECVPSGARPWYVCNTKDRISILKNTISKFRRLQVESPDEYCRSVFDFYGKLREAWERAIEELLLNDVIQRFRPSIETQRLKKVLIESGDYTVIDSGMSKCSTWMTGHDTAAAIASPTPPADEVERDLASFENFTKTIKERAERAGKMAGTLIDPPAAKTAEKRAETVIDLMAG
jgi:energy-coupling factor transporter ATP-binding protein EcfA2